MIEERVGRYLLALLFAAGAVQKALDPGAAVELLARFHLPAILVWPALAFNALAALALFSGVYIRPTALALAAYCIVTSAFHFIPADGWQMSIFIKNWSLSGGLLVLAAYHRKAVT